MSDRELQRDSDLKKVTVLHPAWEALIDYCRRLGFGELERVRIQNGLPMTVEVVRTKMRLLRE